MVIGMLGFQTTVSRPVTLSGTGVHSGAEVSITFNPAEVDTGVVFQRMHENGSVTELRAVSSQVGNTDLCTVLGFSPAHSVATIEHVMAAVYALGLDNVMIEVHGAEMPIMDGSSAPFIEAIEQVGLVSLGVKRRYIRITKPVRIEHGGSWSEFRPYDGTRFEVADRPPEVGRGPDGADVQDRIVAGPHLRLHARRRASVGFGPRPRFLA